MTKFSLIFQLFAVLCTIKQEKKKSAEVNPYTSLECLLYSFLIVHESHFEFARKTNRKLLYSLIPSPSSPVIFRFPSASSYLSLSSWNKSREGCRASWHRNAWDKRKERKRDTAAKKKVTLGRKVAVTCSTKSNITAPMGNRFWQICSGLSDQKVFELLQLLWTIHTTWRFLRVILNSIDNNYIMTILSRFYSLLRIKANL